MAKTDTMAEKLAAALEPEYREEIRHAKCGGVYIAHSPEEVLADDADCPVCTDVRRVARETNNRQLVVSPGTPLAEELGAVFELGKVGPVAS